MGQEKRPMALGARCIRDKLLLPDAYYRSLGATSIVFLWPSQARAEIEKCWRKHSMRVYLVPI